MRVKLAKLGMHLGCISCVLLSDGCARHQARPSVTAVGLSPANCGEPHGIPYYLPKPLLVVAKNVRHIDESKVGLTGPAPIPGGFDNQAAYADIKANVTVPSSSGGAGKPAAQIPAANVVNADLAKAMLPKDLEKSNVVERMTPSATDRFNGGVELDSFFTYQIVFMPDLTQKYGLRISGGAGEIRAAMNLVNGWMYTGMGPFYLKDSSSAQNAMATGAAAMFTGRGVADVVDSVGNVASKLEAAAKKENALTSEQVVQLNNQFQMLQSLAQSTPKVPKEMLNYAEIYIYEPVLAGDQTEWRLVAEHRFNRHYFDEAGNAASVKAKQDILRAMLLGGKVSLPETSGSNASGSTTSVTTTPRSTAASPGTSRPEIVPVPQNSEPKGSAPTVSEALEFNAPSHSDEPKPAPIPAPMFEFPPRA